MAKIEKKQQFFGFLYAIHLMCCLLFDACFSSQVTSSYNSFELLINFFSLFFPILNTNIYGAIEFQRHENYAMLLKNEFDLTFGLFRQKEKY